jgi:GntR family transcriptional regulator
MASMQVSHSLIPRYYQLKEILEKRIQSGEFQPGDQFLTDEELCREYGLSRGTVRRAVDLLVEDHWLRRQQGRGTFVIPPTSSPVFFRLSGFNEEMLMRGRTPSTRLLHKRVLPADDTIAHRLQIAMGEKVIEIARLRLADGLPLASETRYLPYTTCPQLLEEDLEEQSIHSLLIDRYNIPLIRACYTIEAHVLSRQEARLLQTNPGVAGFYVDRVTYTLHDRPVTWYRTVYRGDEYRFTAEFKPCSI